MSASPEVVCVGILVADIFVQPLEALPSAGDLVATDDFLIDTGGCAANAATSLTRLGVSAAAVGMVGNDVFAEFIRKDLRQKGVHAAGIVQSESVGTSKTVILPVIGEDRRYIHTFGANAELRVEHIDKTLVKNAKVLYVGGYLVLPSFDPVKTADLLRNSQVLGTVTLLDVVVPVDQGQAAMDSLMPLLPHVDYFTPNDSEARLLTGETDPERQAQVFLEAGCSTVIITMGERGSFVKDENQSILVPPFPVTAIDGSGAGDAFVAGLISAILDGRSITEGVRFANIVGASACTALGCTAGVVSHAEAQQQLLDYPS